MQTDEAQKETLRHPQNRGSETNTFKTVYNCLPDNPALKLVRTNKLVQANIWHDVLAFHCLLTSLLLLVRALNRNIFLI